MTVTSVCPPQHAALLSPHLHYVPPSPFAHSPFHPYEAAVRPFLLAGQRIQRTEVHQQWVTRLIDLSHDAFLTSALQWLLFVHVTLDLKAFNESSVWRSIL